MLWANKNIGAETEEDAGLYFQWGDTQGYTVEQVGVDKQFTWDDYIWNEGSSVTKYTDDDGLTVLESADDAATINMGSNWRMPTGEELRELISNTDIYFISIDNNEIQATYEGDTSDNIYFQEAETMKGLKFYRKDNRSKYIFIPTSGFIDNGSILSDRSQGRLWSSSVRISRVDDAQNLVFTSSSGIGSIFVNVRYYGFPIRGVKPSQQ